MWLRRPTFLLREEWPHMYCFQYLLRLSSVCKDISNYLKKMLNDFTCFISHAVYLYFLTIAHRHFQMERLVQSFWACSSPVTECITSACWGPSAIKEIVRKKLLAWMRAFSKSDRERNLISVSLDLSSYATLSYTCFLKFISNSSCFGYLCKAVISVLALIFYSL